MPVVQIRHGAVRYKVPKAGTPRGYSIKVGFRSMKVDMPQSEVDRLEPLGAVVGVNDELPKGGKLSPLPNTASDEELIAWVSVATAEEIASQIADTPDLADRIMTARATVTERLKQQNEILGGVDDAVAQGLELAAQRADAEAKAQAEAAVQLPPAVTEPTPAGADVVPPESGGDPSPVTKSDGDDVDHAGNLDEVVAQSVPKVSEYLSEHPEQAAAVLDAEKVRAAQEGAKPPNVREGVIKAVEAAASFQQT
jgi:hypothetical protein